MSKTTRIRLIIVAIVASAIVLTVKFWPKASKPALEVNLQNTTGISDGPYIFLSKEDAQVKWVINDSAYTHTLLASDDIRIHSDVDYTFNIDELTTLLTDVPAQFSNVENIAVLSDIHGQYDLFIRLLKANHIIDATGNWNFAKGHLVIIGDAFDRGDKVTETLWHIIKLSEQAHQAGGRVHYLLGNHDVMVLNTDLRYINEKYTAVEQVSHHSYDQLFGPQTLMGEWLRACPVVLKINDIVFNHAGLSMEMVRHNLSIKAINTTFAEQIIDNHRDSIRANEHLSILARSNGPIWYRGYFKDTTLTNIHIDSILNHFEANHIVVGHTSMEQIEVLFDKRILAADTSIKKGENGELLLIEDDHYYRAGLDGEKQLLW
ncbi:metallophosphoesterase [Carboxylicivirga sediminis]|uniref:Metallophosphoesterase n=1 Tax=Carboxylicivirga sediminis TaxID=2006564 RepID=A0A941IZ06_9BACT|nr:metallophosphoesterase [Carboxylicivirga sediminis]MBR8536337.1 metallophosphoesterase [Carboxylicivirga sediminis]